ncbi:MAG: RDD family protein [Nitrospirae bacterium]|nr:RDD family protein [Nitrospirota bacterium]
MSEETGSAGLLLRTAARVIDFILIAAALEMLPRAGYFAGLAYLLLGDGFFDGRSIGKRLVKIRVVNTERNTACSIRDSILRNSPLALGFSLWVLPWVGWIFVVAAVVMEFILMLGSENGARLGDEIAKTAVLESDGKYDMREA